MADSVDFTATLRRFMARALRGNSDLARLTGISVRTLEKWTAGEIRRPRFGTDVLRVAQALALSAADALALLHAAGLPALDVLHAHARQANDTTMLALLATWQGGVPSTPDGQGAEATPGSASRHQLRPPIADFVGRERETEYLVTALHGILAAGRGAIIGGVLGMGGIGKTELAYYVAHALRTIFPDAQLLLGLRGSSAAPLTAEQALRMAIHAVAPDTRLPDELVALEALYRSVLYGQRVLILADDAIDATQVQPLIPPRAARCW